VEGRYITHFEKFSAKRAALRFLQTLFSDIQMPEKVIVGEPVVRDGTWRQNFHRHMREVFSELGIAQLVFFPEPFAVFQYYRHVVKAFPVAKGRISQLEEDGHSSEKAVCFWHSSPRMPKETLAQCYASMTAYGMMIPRCNSGSIGAQRPPH
jgi:hypothetical protein